MKSILSDKCCKKEEKPFPKLMVSTTGAIVAFSEEGDGTVVNIGTSSEVLLYHSTGWLMRSFKDYEGDVCLTND